MLPITIFLHCTLHAHSFDILEAMFQMNFFSGAEVS